MKKTPETTGKVLFLCLLMALVVSPNVLYVLIVFTPTNAFRMFLIRTFSLALSFYYVIPAGLVFGKGFVLGIGCGPVNPVGYAVAVFFWSGVAYALSRSVAVFHRWRRSREAGPDMNSSP